MSLLSWTERYYCEYTRENTRKLRKGTFLSSILLRLMIIVKFNLVFWIFYYIIVIIIIMTVIIFILI